MRTLLRGGHIVNARCELEQRDIAIAGGRIRFDTSGCDEVIDASGMVITPSFVNSHAHLGETIFSGIAPVTSLKDYLEFTTRASTFINTDDLHTLISMHTIIQHLRTGITLFNAARGFEAVRRIGVRGCLGYPLMDSAKLHSFYQKFMKEDIELEREQSPNGTDRIIPGLWVHSLRAVEEAAMDRVAAYADLPFSIHVSETEEGARDFLLRNGITEIAYLRDKGLLNNRANLVHCNHVSAKDVRLIRDSGAHVSVCPLSNLILGTGFPDLPSMMGSGISASMATDGLATNPYPNLFDTLAFARTLWDVDARALFRMITTTPAQICGFDSVGVIDEGWYADLNFYSYDAGKGFDALFAAFLGGLTPEHVMADGTFLVKDGSLSGHLEVIERKYYKLRRMFEGWVSA